MRCEWKQVKLGDVATVRGGKRLPKNVNLINTPNTHPYIRVRDLNDRVMLELNDSFLYVDDETQKGISRYVVNSDDIVISIVGTIGLVAKIGKTLDGANLTENCVKITNLQNIDKEYLFYYLKSVFGQQEIMRGIVGAVQQKLPIKNIQEITIKCPELIEQKKIAAILCALDEKIATNRAINENLLAQAQTLYKQFFPYGVQNDLPDGWRIGTVGEIIEIHDSKRIPLSGADRSKMEKKIYPYYGAASLMDLVDNYIFDGKYLLLGEDGTVVDDAGYPILQYVWGQFWVNNHAHILTGRLGYDVESLYMLFKQTPVKSIVTGAVQPKISQANLRSVQVVIPPEHNLREYNDLVEPLFSLFRANEEECKDLTALRDTLLPKLMSGEIDVSAVQL